MSSLRKVYVFCRETPTLNDTKKEKNQLRMQMDSHVDSRKERIFATHKFVSNKGIRKILVVIKSESGTNPVIFVSKVLLLWRIHVQRDSCPTEYCFILNMEATPTVDQVDYIL